MAKSDELVLVWNDQNKWTENLGRRTSAQETMRKNMIICVNQEENRVFAMENERKLLHRTKKN